MSDGALSRPDRAFVNEYFLCGMNQTEAYMRTHPKSSYDSARANATRLIAKDSISKEIERRLDEQRMSAKEVLARLSSIGRSDIADFVGIETPSDMLNSEYQGKTHVIKKFKRNVTITRTKDGGETEHQYTELELLDPLSALDKMGKHHNLFKDSVEHSGEVGTYSMSRQEWEKAQAARHNQAQATIADFEDESDLNE